MRAQVRAYKKYMAEMASEAKRRAQAARRRLSLATAGSDNAAQLSVFTEEANSLRAKVAELKPLLEVTTKKAEDPFDDDAHELLAKQRAEMTKLELALTLVLDKHASAEAAMRDAKVAALREKIVMLNADIEKIQTATEPDIEDGVTKLSSEMKAQITEKKTE